MQSRRWITVVAICVFLFVALAGYKALLISRAIAFAESFPEQSETVEAALVVQKPWVQNVSALGEVVAPQSVELRNELEGKISQVGFTSGIAVKKGQLLVQLDASEEQAQLKAAQAEAELARLALQRYSKLMKSNASSKDQYDQANAEYAVAVARAQALQATIDKKTLTAPFDAIAGLHTLEVGQFLSANTLVTRLVGVSADVWVDFYLPQQQAALPVGTPVSVTARSLLEAPVSGRIIAKDPSVTQSSRNLRFRAQIDKAPAALRPGVAVDVGVAAGMADSSLVLPSSAIRYDTTGPYVFVIKSVTKPADEKGKAVNELRASRRDVVLGSEQAKHTVIVSGVAAGERVATNGSFKLRDGMLTFIRDRSAGNQPAGTGKPADAAAVTAAGNAP
jgi:membrane fusion protein (multidrug efflux system)